VAAEELAEELRALGYDARVYGQYAVFMSEVPLGARAGEVIEVALPATDWPLTPPGGPHIKPGFDHPGGANHASELGPDWRYWSRPFPEWVKTDRSADAYLAHLRGLLGQVV
jgi:hypothetical protein